MVKILVLIDSSTEFSRRFLTGLINYSKENGSWTFYRLPTYYKKLYGEKGVIDKITQWGINAVVAQWEYGEIGFLKQLNIPVFLQNYKRDSNWFSKIAGNYGEVGAMAANFFAKKRFRDFAFYGDKDFLWSKGRAEGYRVEVEKLGGNFYYYESDNLANSHWSQNHIELGNWLLSLPKPVALFACDDYFALQVSEMCKVHDIDIPNEISLLGVDNDEFICNLSHPSISSIVTNDEEIGYNTGKMLHKQVMNNENVPFNIVKKPIRIELRQSTEKYNISDDYITSVINYIEENITSALSVDILTEVVPLSRRNLEKKFRETMGTSVYQFILEKKVEHLSNELLRTDKSLLDIAIESGFGDVRSVYRIFKNHTGYTPANFRKKFSQKEEEL